MSELMILLLVTAVVLGLLYGIYWLPQSISYKRSFFKTIPVVLLSLVALNAYSFGLVSIFLFIALALSAAGDAFLSRDGERLFLAGLGAFLMSHLTFVALFIVGWGSVHHPNIQTVMLVFAIVVLILLVLRNLWAHLGEMKLPVVIYTFVIAAMVVSAWVTGQNYLLLFGVTLFAFSDLILAHEMFVWQDKVKKRVASSTVWFSYLAAQTIITGSLIL